MVVYFECPECACACACTEFQIGGPVACERCGRRVKVPRWAFHPPMTSASSNAGGAGDPQRRHAFDRSLIPTPAPLAARISRHIERDIGPCPMVFHHTLASDDPLDIHVVPPQMATNASQASSLLHVYTLATSGLSSRRPNPRLRRRTVSPLSELMISLPANWPGLRPDGMFDHQLIRLPEYAWPIEWLKTISSLAFQYSIDPVAGMVFPAKGKSHLSAPGSNFAGVMLAPSVLRPNASPLVVNDDLEVSFLSLWPLFAEELRLARRKGPEELLARFMAQGITDVVCPSRPRVE